jgi:adenine-specific DNA-methyltransferase
VPTRPVFPPCGGLYHDDAELENKIDLIVYKLYGLTYEEVKIIAPEFELNKAEYE